ncbi:hypothetical protein BC835DRAFT_1311020 [Cytidiella melzeri]|nr:hypothetical protein BC835DRAFT_1311020 [Cytidiella melzeri]
MTKSGLYKDQRDTVNCRVRHRDGTLLRGGIGLTTGLGWNMGLTGHEGAKIYNMILATVRELVHAAQLDLSRPYRCVSAEDLSKIFVSARRIHSYLECFEGDWVTAAIVKQFMSSARRYGKKMQYFGQADDNCNSNVM